jgi:hypothetical protein
VAHKQAINGEVAALDVFLRGIGVDDLIRMTPVGVADVVTERGDFDFDVFSMDDNHSEMCAYAEGVGEELQNLFGMGVGSDVVVRRFAVKEKIADAAAHEESLVVMRLKHGANRIGECAGIHMLIMRQRRPCSIAGAMIVFKLPA